MTDRTDSHTLSAFLTTLARALYALPAPGGGSPAEHKRQVGHLFPAATAFVFHTLSALERHPDLYPDLRGSAPGIREHQDRADAWLDIETLAQNLARLARQHHAREQAQAIIQSKEVLARARPPAPEAGPRRRARPPAPPLRRAFARRPVIRHPRLSRPERPGTRAR
jgi:hypothetical protein